MTPQQATADQATIEVMQHFVANISGLELREKIKQTIIKAMECRAPAPTEAGIPASPTEPAVDRDARNAQRAIADIRRFVNESSDKNLGMWIDDDIDTLTTYLATPASPAEPWGWAIRGTILREQFQLHLASDPAARDYHDYVSKYRYQGEAVHEIKPLYEHPTPQVAQASQPIPDVLFDGMAVFNEIHRGSSAKIGAKDVSAVLDAVVRLMRASQPTSAEGKDSERLDWLDDWILENKRRGWVEFHFAFNTESTAREQIDAEFAERASTGKGTDKEATK